MFGFQSKKKLEDRAYDLVDTAKWKAELLNKQTDFDFFMQDYDEVLECMKEASEIEEKVKSFKTIHGNLKGEYLKLKFQMQWHMRDALERDYDEIIKDAKGKYRNNKGMIQASCRNFKERVDKYRNTFEEETEVFADSLLKKLSIKFNVSLFEDVAVAKGKETDSCGIYDFDTLEGHEFEYWCANLLRQNGFEAIEVTQGSGDQGVDVIAEKDGIRYAIQCKNYSSSLGNTPIQEVCAGKAFYHCQIGVVMTNRFFTNSAQELAKATGTLLWDRNRILKMLNQ